MKKRQRGRTYSSTNGSQVRSAAEWGVDVEARVIKRSDSIRIGRTRHRFEGRAGDAGAGANRTEPRPVRRKSRRRFSEAVSRRSGQGGRPAADGPMQRRGVGDGLRSLLPVRPRRNRPPERTRKPSSEERPVAESSGPRPGTKRRMDLGC